MKALSPIHKMVARELALGFSLPEICSVRGLDVETWERITGSTLFKGEVARISSTIEEQIIQDESESPVLQKLKAASLKAVDVLVGEMENYDKDEMGATASTRTSAAKAVLDYAGYSNAKDQSSPTVMIQISAGKMNSLFASPIEIKAAPQNIVHKAAKDD